MLHTLPNTNWYMVFCVSRNIVRKTLICDRGTKITILCICLDPKVCIKSLMGISKGQRQQCFDYDNLCFEVISFGKSTIIQNKVLY